MEYNFWVKKKIKIKKIKKLKSKLWLNILILKNVKSFLSLRNIFS